MHDAIEWAGQSLKCDAAGCDHVEPVPEITADLIGTPCPKCGANLLTEEDHAAGLEIQAMVALINEAIGPVDVPDEVVRTATAVSFNPHKGSLTIKVGE